MHKSVVIGALSGAILFAVAASAADQAAKPTDPQITHIAYTAGKVDIEAAQQALNKSKKAATDLRQRKKYLHGSTFAPKLPKRGTPR